MSRLKLTGAAWAANDKVQKIVMTVRIWEYDGSVLRIVERLQRAERLVDKRRGDFQPEALEAVEITQRLVPDCGAVRD